MPQEDKRGVTAETHTVQYDRLSGRFVTADGAENPIPSSKVEHINFEANNIREWLNLKRKNGKFSHGFLVELLMGSLARTLHVHLIYDEIAKLEGADTCPSLTKKPRKMRPPLADLWHKHYFQPGFLIRNLRDEADKMLKDGRWERIFSPHYGKYIEEVSGQIAHDMVVGAFERRMRDRRATGEFIVYEKLNDGTNYYITLGVHGDWEKIRRRVDEYKDFDVDGGW